MLLQRQDRSGDHMSQVQEAFSITRAAEDNGFASHGAAGVCGGGSGDSTEHRDGCGAASVDSGRCMGTDQAVRC